METKSVRISGPHYLNGRPRNMLTEALQPKTKAATTPSTTFATDLRAGATRIGDGVPFSVLYMTRANKKLTVLPQAA